jgi:hypothetical protein
MTERQNQTVKNQNQEPPRQPYGIPRLTRHGTVAELTGIVSIEYITLGSGIVSDGTSLPP